MTDSTKLFVARAMRRAKSDLWKATIPLDLFVSVMVTGFLLARHATVIGQAEPIVLCYEGGYGHTVIMPEVARKIFPGKAVFIFVSERRRHNWKQASIWPDIRVIHLLKGIKPSKWQNHCMIRFVEWTLAQVFQKDVVLTHNQYNQDTTGPFLYDMLRKKISDMSGEILQPQSTPDVQLYGPYWFHARREIPAEPLRVPRRVSERFSQAIQQHFGGRKPKWLTIYMRDKGRGSSSPYRSGGGFEDYRAIVQFLDQQGYRILLVGDRTLSDCSEDLREYFWDARRLGFNQNWFNILAASECERFIGDPGGGLPLPCLFEKPILKVNTFPYSVAMPYSLILFKRLIDANGKEVPITECLSNWLWNYEFPSGYHIRDNTVEELLGSVTEFLSIPVDRWREWVRPQPVFPSGGWAAEAPARLVSIQDTDI